MSDAFARRFAEQLSPIYQVERELGGGGMSRIFLAREIALARRVVIKALPPELVAAVNVERFRREIAIAAGLMHPHIVPVHHASQSPDGVLYYSMPFIEGQSLRERIEAGPLSLSEALRVLRDVASALSYAHHNDVVHRDMKPENVLLASGFALVADFGIAKALHSAERDGGDGSVGHGVLTNVGVPMGTPEYMSPEQAVGDGRVDARADLYALGVIAYELVTGATPFAGQTPRAMIVAHVGEQPKALANIAPRLPSTLTSIIMQCLAKEPTERPLSADVVGAAFEALLGSDEVVAYDAEEVADGRVQGSIPRGRSAEALRIQTTLKAHDSVPVARRGLLARPVVLVAVGLLLLIATAAVGSFLVGRSAEKTPFTRIAVATMSPATNSTVGIDDGRAFSEAIQRAVSGLDGQSVASRDEVLFAEEATNAPLSLPTLAAALHARLLITGRISPLGRDSLSISVRIVDSSGTPQLTFDERVIARIDLRDAATHMAERVAGAVAMITSPVFGKSTVPRGNAPTQAALKAVEEGLELEAGLRAPQANEDAALAELNRFDRAARENPDFQQARLWFASAATRRTGGEDVAASALSIVDSNRDQLTLYESTLLDALNANVSGNHELSLRSWRVAAEIAPTWPNLWWLAMTLRDVNRPRESLALLQRLARSRQSLLRWTPSVHHYLSDFDAELRAVTQEASLAPATANSLGMQQALLQSLAAREQWDDVAKHLDAIVTLPAEAGASVAYVLTRTAWELDAHGSAAARDDALSRAATWCDRRTARDLENAELAFDCLEAFALAGRTRRLARAAEPLLSVRPDDLMVLGTVGLAAAQRGERETALRFASRIAMFTRPGGSRGLSWWLRGRIHAALGERDEAVALLRDAFSRGAGWSERFDLHRDPAFSRLRGYPPFELLRTPQG